MHQTDQSPAGEEGSNLEAQAARRTNVDALAVKGREPHEIADELGVPLAVVIQDVQALEAERFARAARPSAQILVFQLASLDLVQKEAWIAWERSWNVQTRTTKGRKTLASGDQGQVAVTETDRLGDTKYLTLVLNCIDRRCELLGVKGPIALDEVQTRKLAEAARHMSPEDLRDVLIGSACLHNALHREQPA